MFGEFNFRSLEELDSDGFVKDVWILLFHTDLSLTDMV